MAKRSTRPATNIASFAELDAAGFGLGYRPTSYEDAAEPLEEQSSKPSKRTAMQTMADTGLEVASGAVKGIKFMSDVFGTDNAVSTALDDVSKFAKSLQSAQAHGEDARMAQIMKEAEDKGIWEQVKAAASAASEAPIRQSIGAVATGIPMIAASMVPGMREASWGTRLATMGGLGAAQGAGMVKSSMRDAVYQRAIEEGRSPQEAAALADQAQSYQENPDQIALGGLMGGAATATGFAPAMVRALSPVGANAAKTMSMPTIGKALGMGVLKEVPMEAAQGGHEQLAGNVAQNSAGFATQLGRGVAGSAAMEGMLAAPGGAVGGAFDYRSDRADFKAQQSEKAAAAQAEADAAAAAIRANKQPGSGPLSNAVNAGTEADAQKVEVAGASAAAAIASAPDLADAAPSITSPEGSAEFINPDFQARQQTLAEQMANQENREKVRARFGDDGVNQMLYYAQAAGRADIPAKTSDNMLQVAERMMGEVLLQPFGGGAQLGGMVRDPLTLDAPEVAGAQPLGLGLDQTPSGRFTVGPDGTATAETRVQQNEAQRRAQEIDSLGNWPLRTKMADGDILNPSGQPFKTLVSANLAAKKTPGDVVAVDGGFVVRPAASASITPETGNPAATDGQTITPQSSGAVPTPAQPVTPAPLTRARTIEPGPAVVLQNRDRSSAASVAQMNEIAAKPDYLRAGPARVMDSGAPVVFGETPSTAVLGREETVADGRGNRTQVQYMVVEAEDLLTSHSADGSRIPEYEQGAAGKLRAVAGNGRAAGIANAYTRGTAEQYRADLAADAPSLGIDQQSIQAMSAPVLVRVMSGNDVTPDIGDRSNISGTARLSASEQATTDARRINLSALEFDEQGDPAPESVRQFISGMPTSERGELLNKDGTPTRQAIDRIMAATFKQAYGSDDLVQLYAQATDIEARTVMTALADAAGAMSNLTDAGDLDIRGAVSEAAGMAVNARRKGTTLADALKNADLDTSGEAFVIARFFSDNIRSAKKIADGLRNWANYAAEQAQIARDNQTQDGLFGAAPVASRYDIFQRIENGQVPKTDARQPARQELATDSAQRQENITTTGQVGQATGQQQSKAQAEGLTAPTQADIEAQQARAEQAEKSKAAQAKADAARADKERERKDVAAASVAAADTFELGQDAMANLTGQQDVFGAMEQEAPQMTAEEAAAYLKDFVYNLDQLDGMTPRAQVSLSSPMGKSGRDTLLMDAFGISREKAHDINNRLDSRQPKKLRNIDMQEAFDVFPGLRKIVDDAIQNGQPKAKTEPSSQFTDLEKELQAQSHATELDGDIGIVAGGGVVRYVSLDDAVSAAKKAIESGVKAVPFQIHNATGIRIGDVDRVLVQVNGENEQGDDGLMFSRAAAKEVRDLVTLHNLSEDNLMYAGKMGGIPVPSIGITKVETPFGGFGSITLIAQKDLIDPESGVPVYDRDAWTARFPKLNFKKVKAKVADAFYERMQSVRDFGSDGGQFMSMLFEELRNSNVQAPDKITSLFTRYTAPKMLYAQEVLGKTIKPPMRDIKSETPFGHAKSWRDFVAKNYKAGMTEQQEKEFNRLAAVAARAAMAEINTENKARVDERTARMLDSSMNGYLDRYISENYGMNAGILDRAVRDVKSFGKKEVDPMKLDEAVRKVVPTDDAGYNKWIANLVEPLFEAPTITLRGAEVPVTLDNIVDAMTIGKTAGAEKSMTFGAGKAASMLGKQFKSIDEIKAARDRVVSTASESEGKKSTEALISEYQNHVSEFYTGKDWKGNIDTWAALDSSLEALTKAGRTPTDASMNIALQRAGFKRVDAKGISLAKQALEALRDASTNYFEAKPQRAVRLNEFKGAVVPKGTSAEAIALLEENGITVEVHGNAEGAREKAIQKLAKKLDGKTGNVIFSRDTESPRTPAATIRAAITKAYGNLLDKLEGKGMVTIAQTEREAIEAAAQARADKTGGDVEQIKRSMLASVQMQRALPNGSPESKAAGVNALLDSLFADPNSIGYVTHIQPLIEQVNYLTGGNNGALNRGKQAATNKYGLNGLVGNAHFLSYISEAPAFVKHGLGSLDAPSKRVVLGAMRSMLQDLKIRESVVKLVPVDVVNVLGATQYSAEMLFNDVPMLLDLLSSNGDKSVPSGINGSSSAVSRIAGVIAEGSGLVSGFDRKENDPATGASVGMLFGAHKGNYNTIFDGADTQIVDVKYSANGNIEGFFDKQTGKSFLVADNLTAASAPGTLMHEVGIHMAADGKMDALFKRAGSLLKTGTQNEFIQRVKARMARAGETSDEEAAAYIVTEYERDRLNSPLTVGKWLADLTAAVRAWLFSKGIILKAEQLTVADIAAVARANARSMARGGPNGGPGGGQAFSRTALPATLNIDGKDRPTTNSNGQPIHPTEEGVRNFWRWFGDSRVVDDNGRPLVVYHGTAYSFDEFDPGMSGNTYGADEEGIFFTTDTEEADVVSIDARNDDNEDQSGSNVMPVLLLIKNPLTVSFDEFSWQSWEIPSATNTYDSHKERILSRFRAGDDDWNDYDGIVITGKDKHKTFVAFNPTQIKSATGNTGAFSPTDPEIRFSRAADMAGNAIDKAKQTADKAMGKDFPRAASMPDLNDDQRSLLGKVGASQSPASDAIKAATDRAGLKIRQGMVDRFAALKELDEKALGQNFIADSITNSAWVLAKMSSAGSGALNAMMKTGRIEMDAQQKVIGLKGAPNGGLTASLQKLGGPAEVERFFAWVAANRSHAIIERNKEAIAKTAEAKRELKNIIEMQAIPGKTAQQVSQLSDARKEWEKIIAKHEPFLDVTERLFTEDEVAAGRTLNTGTTEGGKVRPALYSQVHAEFQQYRDDVLAIAEQAGIINGENRAMWRDEFYVPFYRVMEDDADRGRSGGNGLSRQEAYKKLKGGKQNLNNLMENTLMNFHHLLSASLKNQAAVQAIKNAEHVGIARKVPEARRDTKTSTFVLVDGKKVFYEVDDPLVFESITTLADPGLNNTAVRVMGAFKRLFTNMTTATPQFITASMFRDLLQASATSPTSKNIAKNLKEGIQSYRDEKTRAEMLASGGAFSFGHIYGMGADEVKASLQKTVAGAGLISKPSMIPSILRKGWDAWGDITDLSENASRAATYAQNVDQMGKLRAAFEARDVMDFSQHGAWPAVRLLVRIVPFLNARLQGLDKLYRSGLKPSILTAMGKGTDTDKQAAARFAMVTGALTLATMALYLINADDDEYKKLEEWQKDTYWFIRIGENAFFLPKPFEVGAIATIAERTLQQAMDDKATGKLFRERMWDMLMQTFAFNPTPQMFQPLVDVYSNKDAFTGRDIETAGMERMSAGLRSRDTTTAPATALSAVSRVFGDESSIAVSPVQADHLIKGYLGGVGAMAAGWIDTMYRAATGQSSPDKAWSEYQPIRRFYRDLDVPVANTRYTTLFYDGLKEANRVYADVMELQKLGRTEEAEALAAEKRNPLQIRIALNAQQRRLTEINNRMKEVRRSDRDGEWKRRELDLLTTQKALITERLGKRIEDARATQ